MPTDRARTPCLPDYGVFGAELVTRGVSARREVTGARSILRAAGSVPLTAALKFFYFMALAGTQKRAALSLSSPACFLLNA